MDIVGIERESFDSFKKKIEQIVSLVPNEFTEVLPIESEWIEGKELSDSLNISLRRLQHLRESGKLSFSAVGKKIYYRIPEVKALLVQGKLHSKK